MEDTGLHPRQKTILREFGKGKIPPRKNTSMKKKKGKKRRHLKHARWKKAAGGQ